MRKTDLAAVFDSSATVTAQLRSVIPRRAEKVAGAPGRTSAKSGLTVL
jgi:hypothetical protein